MAYGFNNDKSKQELNVAEDVSSSFTVNTVANATLTAFYAYKNGNVITVAGEVSIGNAIGIGSVSRVLEISANNSKTTPRTGECVVGGTYISGRVASMVKYWSYKISVELYNLSESSVAQAGGKVRFSFMYLTNA